MIERDRQSPAIVYWRQSVLLDCIESSAVISVAPGRVIAVHCGKQVDR
jgi:hypothetical protein